jgi:ketosteroid isomerase-like protein
VFTAEDVRIQQYGNTAIVAFRLVSTTTQDGESRVAQYLNSGTFLKRDGTWKVASWQATRKPRAEDEARRDAAAADSAFHQALLAADIVELADLTDDSFVWTRGSERSTTKQQLLDEMGSGRLRYSRLESRDVTVSIFGDAAVVSGVSTLQRSATPGSPGGRDAAALTDRYTLTLIERGGAWKVVSMHTAR